MKSGDLLILVGDPASSCILELQPRSNSPHSRPDRSVITSWHATTDPAHDKAFDMNDLNALEKSGIPGGPDKDVRGTVDQIILAAVLGVAAFLGFCVRRVPTQRAITFNN